MSQRLPPVAFPRNALPDADYVGQGEKGAVRSTEDDCAARQRRAVVLPCQNSNNCNEADQDLADLHSSCKHVWAVGTARAKGGPIVTSSQPWRLPSTQHAKTAFALAHNVRMICQRNGIEKIGFLTLTFAEHILDRRQAQRRYHSLAAGVLSKRYSETITAVERQASGRIHYHLIVNLGVDIRGGIDFNAIARDDYRTANKALRDEWAFWRKTAKEYGFGRTELLPVKSTEQGIANYLGKYIAKHITVRKSEDKGWRLVRSSKAAQKASVRFSWNTRGMRKWRECLAVWSAQNGITDYDQLTERCGPRWAWVFREQIMTVLDGPESREVALRSIPASPNGRNYQVEPARSYTPGLPSKPWNPGFDLIEEIAKEWARSRQRVSAPAAL